MAAVTTIRGSESTAQGATISGVTDPARRIRDVSRDLMRFDPDAAPLTQILLAAKARPATQPKVEWADKTLATKWTFVSVAVGAAASANLAAQAVTISDNIAETNDVYLVVRTGEIFRVTAGAGTTSLTVTRNIGGSGTNTANGTSATLTATDDIVKIGTAFAEGAGAPSERTWNETWRYNFTQIFKTAFGVTGTDDASSMYFGRDLAQQQVDAAIDHKVDLERSLLLGWRYEDTSAVATPIRYAGGLINQFLTSNITDAGGTLTEPEFEMWLENVFAHTGGSSTRLLMCGARVITVIDQLAAGRLMMVPSDQTFGINIRQWNTGHGNVMVKKHFLLENTPQSGGSGGGYGNYALALEMSQISRRPMAGRDTKLEEGIQLPDADGTKDQFKTEESWEIKGDLLHGVLKNVTG